MTFDELFPSKYVRASDLKGSVVPVTIRRIQQEQIKTKDGTEIKGVAYFEGFEKGMVLNITNGKTIGKLHGMDPMGWIGRSIYIYPTECTVGGDVKACIRVKLEAPASSAVVVKPSPPPVEEKLAGGITF